MSKEFPSPENTTKDHSSVRVALVDAKAVVFTVCHKCGKILYSAQVKNFTTSRVAESTARDHGNFFSSPHHVSVVSAESNTSLTETYTVNEKKQLGAPIRKPFPFIPPEIDTGI